MEQSRVQPSTMPAPSPFPTSQPPLQFPALYLYPINDSFIPKHIALSGNQHVKIGRQTNAKTAPGDKNGYFDSKVLSRQHAEVWEEGGKVHIPTLLAGGGTLSDLFIVQIFIKDVKSSNGTFINGERLSPEGIESEPYELKSDDIVVS
jgi:pSer/pThr/pTyr-binding forkhead associated (FHA) protein